MSMQKTTHRLVQGDARNLSFIPDKSIHLIITSPPYWILKRYREHPDQMGHIGDYEEFIEELSKVWKHCFRVLVFGGRLVCVVGDVCLSRRKFGRHVVVPLHADILVSCKKIGFDNLNPIIWHKITNITCEVNNGAKFLGKPYEPNGIIKNDIEFILMQRKPGGYRKPTAQQRQSSIIDKKDYASWFQQFWNIPGASTRNHPAPFPLELAYRLIRMFSFYGDTILDPFCGSGTTMLAAIKSHRNSIGIEIDPEYCQMALKRIQQDGETLLNQIEIEFEKLKTLSVRGQDKKMNQNTVIAELESVLERLEIVADQCARKLLRIEEAQKAIRDTDRRLEELLPPNSTAYRIYDHSKKERTLWWKDTKSGYIDSNSCGNIEQWIKIVRNVINEYEPEFLRSEGSEKKQYFLSAGDMYRAKKLLFKIMKRAKKNLVIVDEYLDEEIFDYIESLDISVDIQFITGNQKPIFPKLYNDLKTTRPNIEAREHHDCHDRFLYVDKAELWHLGASINRIGEKAFMINKVIDLDAYNRFLSNFNIWWSNGKMI